VPAAKGTVYRLCGNSSAYGVCNWAVPVTDSAELCQSCRLNEAVPDLSGPGALESWKHLEAAKRRLYYALDQLGLPIDSLVSGTENGLVFSFKQDTADEKVFTGHADGLITINMDEADDPLREKLRKNLGESYRTLLGHFRHEIGHYYWDRLVRDSRWLEPCRALFGDETIDYPESIKRHYSEGAPANWPRHFVSAYATMHPWEDWAETWAHYMHMVDTLDIARNCRLTFAATSSHAETLTMDASEVDFSSFQALLDAWVPLTVTLNSLNRSMGVNDPYPFVLTAEITRKIQFVHDLVQNWNADAALQDAALARWKPVEQPIAAVPRARAAHIRPQPVQEVATAAAG
jgi:hypothetical protein